MKVDYKYRVRVLLAVSVILLLAAYVFAIKPTLKLSSRIITLKDRIDAVDNLPDSILAVRNELARVNDLIGLEKSSEDVTSGKQQFINRVGVLGQQHGVFLKEFVFEGMVEQDELTIEMNKMTLQGDFNSLLIFLHELEKDHAGARLFSFRFFTETNIRTRVKKLNLLIYVQFIQGKET